MLNFKKPSILIIEDSENDTELIKIALNNQTIASNLRFFDNGHDALDYLSRINQVELPALILLDLYLPKISGIEILQRIRANQKLKQIPIIIFTSSVDEADIIKSYDNGANAFIRKKLDVSEFQAALKNLNIYWLAK